MNTSLAGTPRAAYVHVPFCAHRCGYCNFALVARRSDLIPRYLTAIEKELAATLLQPCEVDTLYFGGGTPTQLGIAGCDRLAELATTWHPLARGYEWTVEANPADVTPELMAVLQQWGVNRLSLGAQSFDAEKLRTLERDHTANDIVQAVHLAHGAGMAVALDLIFAVPGETIAIWQRDLKQAIAVSPEHISIYGLTFEKGTRYWNRRRHGQLAEVDEETQRAMYVDALDRLAVADFEHYEISNLARPGHRSRHNETYWQGDEYHAVGPGAARYVAGVRETNHRSTTTYLQRVLAGKSAVAERETLAPEQRARERLVFSLRRLEGIGREEFRRQTGKDLDQLASGAIDRFTRWGLLADDGQQIQLTREGLLVSDSMWPEML